MTPFKPFVPELHKEQNVQIDFYRHEQKSIMLVTLKGDLPDGSGARLDCDYIHQELAINLLAMRPIALLLDLSLLKYSFGNSLIHAFSPLFELQLFESKFDIAFLLSDLNKYGLAGLWNFDVDGPPENIFYRYEEAVQYAELVYDRL
ncbi:hypothetical protein [Flaviaesturariibacter amylovorans]|uniref:STAS domain-containing protein n=1 Tax=Flaviaesturariibacter amylovorans TaxID=1084520 RepID=A0ABP8HKH5_9BACT